MQASWLEKLRAGRTVLVDGGTGSELRRRGAPLDPQAWSGAAALTRFDLLTAVHADFLRAGAEVITTNTFGTNRFVLRAAGLDECFAEINCAAVEAARRARDVTGIHADIAGSLSCLPPAFDVAAYPDPQAECDAYLELAELLADAGVDLLMLEMMEETVHARRACDAARKVGLPVWLGVSCRLEPAGGGLVGYDFPDVRLETLLDALLDYAPAVVNVMHTPTDAVRPALEAVSRRWSGWLGAYPELPEVAAAESAMSRASLHAAAMHSPAARSAAVRSAAACSPAALAALAVEWTVCGARIVGGCCGATPDHIRAVSAALAP